MDQPWLSTVSKSLLALGAMLMITAVISPVDHSSLLWLGLALWPIAAIAKVTRHYLRRDPIPGRQGALLKASENPFWYHLSFAVEVAIFLLITIFVIRAYVAA